MAAHLLSVVAVILVGMTMVMAQSGQIDYDILLNNEEYVKKQLACVLLERADWCDKIGDRIKKLMPENAKTGTCPQCNDQEKIYIVKVAQKVKNNYPAEWKKFLEVYKVPVAIQEGFLQTKA